MVMRIWPLARGFEEWEAFSYLTCEWVANSYVYSVSGCCTQRSSICLCLCRRLHLASHTHSPTGDQAKIHTHTHTHTYTHAHTHTHSHPYTHTHKHAQTHTHTYTYTPTHVHTHTHKHAHPGALIVFLFINTFYMLFLNCSGVCVSVCKRDEARGIPVWERESMCACAKDMITIFT